MREDARFDKFRQLGVLYWNQLSDGPGPLEQVEKVLGRELIETDPFDGSVLALEGRNYVWMDMVRLARDLETDGFSPTRIKNERGAFSKSMVDELLYQSRRTTPSAVAREWAAQKLVFETTEMLRKYPDRAEALRRKSKPFLREVVAATVPAESPRYDYKIHGDPVPPEIIAEQYKLWKVAREDLLQQIKDL